MKKSILLIAALFACTIPGFAGMTALHIHTAAYGLITVLLEEKPVLTFNDDNSLTIEVMARPEQPPMSISFDDIKSCDYGDSDKYNESGVKTVIADENAVIVRIDAESVTLEGLTDNSDVEVYNLAGIKVKAGKPFENRFRILRSELAAGIYIVRAGKFVTKLAI